MCKYFMRVFFIPPFIMGARNYFIHLIANVFAKQVDENDRDKKLKC